MDLNYSLEEILSWICWEFDTSVAEVLGECNYAIECISHEIEHKYYFMIVHLLLMFKPLV